MDRLQRRRSSFALLSIVVCGALFAACSSSDSQSGSAASSRDRSRGLCTLITPADVEAITGSAVGTPRSVLQGEITDCTYGSANPSHSVLIRYETSATASSFANKREAIVSLGNSVTAVSDLGDQAFTYSQTVGGTTQTTVVARQGMTMVLVTGTTATPDEVDALAQKALDRAD